MINYIHGHWGGKILAYGSLEDIINSENSLTRKYLAEKKIL